MSDTDSVPTGTLRLRVSNVDTLFNYRLEKASNGGYHWLGISASPSGKSPLHGPHFWGKEPWDACVEVASKHGAEFVSSAFDYRYFVRLARAKTPAVPSEASHMDISYLYLDPPRDYILLEGIRDPENFALDAVPYDQHRAFNSGYTWYSSEGRLLKLRGTLRGYTTMAEARTHLLEQYPGSQIEDLVEPDSFPQPSSVS